MGASLTYYYNLQDPGTYMYHCHVEATEHMQMGMLGNLYVRPAQNGTPLGVCAGGARAPSSRTTTVTAPPDTTWSTRSSSAASTPSSTTPAGSCSRCPSP